MSEQEIKLKPKPGGHVRSALQRNAIAAIRQEQALHLAAQGWTTPQISRELGYADRTGAWAAIKTAIEKMPASEYVEEFRESEGARLDVAQAAIWDKVQAGDLQAINAYLRISERRSALFGLDMPKEHILSLRDRKVRIAPDTDWHADLAALAPGPVDDSEPPGEGEDAGDGAALG